MLPNEIFNYQEIKSKYILERKISRYAVEDNIIESSTWAWKHLLRDMLDILFELSTTTGKYIAFKAIPYIEHNHPNKTFRLTMFIKSGYEDPEDKIPSHKGNKLRIVWDGFRTIINPILRIINLEFTSIILNDGAFIGIGIRIKQGRKNG